MRLLRFFSLFGILSRFSSAHALRPRDMLSLTTAAAAFASPSLHTAPARRAAPPVAVQSPLESLRVPLQTVAATLFNLGLAAQLTVAPLPASADITKADIIAAEERWGDGIVRVGEIYSKGGDYKSAAKILVDLMYGYDQGPVLFKPTKAAEKEFRVTPGEAYSYFVTGQEVEDKGFAIHPWSKAAVVGQKCVCVRPEPSLSRYAVCGPARSPRARPRDVPCGCTVRPPPPSGSLRQQAILAQGRHGGGDGKLLLHGRKDGGGDQGGLHVWIL